MQVLLTQKLLILLHLSRNITERRRLLLTHPTRCPIGDPLGLLYWLYPNGKSSHQSQRKGQRKDAAYVMIKQARHLRCHV